MNEIIVLKNVRRLMTKAFNKRTPNIVLIQEIFGCGSTSARKKCDELGIDAYDYNL